MSRKHIMSQDKVRCGAEINPTIEIAILVVICHIFSVSVKFTISLQFISPILTEIRSSVLPAVHLTWELISNA